MIRRLTLSYVSVTAVVLVGLGVAFEVEYTARERERVEAATEHDAHVLAALYEDALEDGGALAATPAERYRQRTGADVMIVDRGGAVAVDTAGEPGTSAAALPEIAAALAGRTEVVRRSAASGPHQLHLAVPVASGGGVYGAVRITRDTAPLDARIQRSRTALIVLSLIVLAAVAAISWMIGRSVTRPVRRLNATAERFAAGDLATGADPVEGPPEVRALAESMTVMGRRIDELLRTQRRFVADASHQLRTPLTALQLRLENLHARLPAESAEQVEPAIEELERLTTLVGKLLRLTDADEHSSVGTTDLVALVAARVDTWQALAESAEVRLVADLPTGAVLVRAEDDVVQQMLDNLLENAFNAAPVATTVTVRVEASDTDAAMTVLDEGLGLTDDEKRLATQRFWHGKRSPSGSGLGLAIVDALASACGATLRLDDAPGTGLAVSVTFVPADVTALRSP